MKSYGSSDKVLRLEQNKLTSYASPVEFLSGLGYLPGLTGTVLSVERTEDAENLVVFVRNTIVSASVLREDDKEWERGQKVQVQYRDGATPELRKL